MNPNEISTLFRSLYQDIVKSGVVLQFDKLCTPPAHYDAFKRIICVKDPTETKELYYTLVYSFLEYKTYHTTIFMSPSDKVNFLTERTLDYLLPEKDFAEAIAGKSSIDFAKIADSFYVTAANVKDRALYLKLIAES